LPGASNLNKIADIEISTKKYLRHLSTKTFKILSEAGGGGDGKNLALQDIRFQELLIEYNL
jgi:predicted glycosyltransferase